jgi:hypothetical protein
LLFGGDFGKNIGLTIEGCCNKIGLSAETVFRNEDEVGDEFGEGVN